MYYTETHELTVFSGDSISIWGSSHCLIYSLPSCFCSKWNALKHYSPVGSIRHTTTTTPLHLCSARRSRLKMHIDLSPSPGSTGLSFALIFLIKSDSQSDSVFFLNDPVGHVFHQVKHLSYTSLYGFRGSKVSFRGISNPVSGSHSEWQITTK